MTRDGLVISLSFFPYFLMLAVDTPFKKIYVPDSSMKFLDQAAFIVVSWFSIHILDFAMWFPD